MFHTTLKFHKTTPNQSFVSSRFGLPGCCRSIVSRPRQLPAAVGRIGHKGARCFWQHSRSTSSPFYGDIIPERGPAWRASRPRPHTCAALRLVQCRYRRHRGAPPWGESSMLPATSCCPVRGIVPRGASFSISHGIPWGTNGFEMKHSIPEGGPQGGESSLPVVNRFEIVSKNNLPGRDLYMKRR
jgi:hypothetical protein